MEALNLHLEEHKTKNPAVPDDEEEEENDMVSTSEAEEAGVGAPTDSGLVPHHVPP